MTITIHFDGGTPCNIPRLGYGIGYGSYNYNGGTPIRVSHGIRCSANAAEILTLCEALEKMPKCFTFSDEIRVFGDSRIALKWLNIATGKFTPKKKKGGIASGSEAFQHAIHRLNETVKKFHNISGSWLPRAHAVAAFGH